MGYASHEGKAWTIRQLQLMSRDPAFFLDLGAGAGAWMEAMRPWFLDSRWIAIEAWQPYIERFLLPLRYSLVIPGDIRDIPFPQVDVVIAGDVLEHMSVKDAVDVWDRARAAARQAVVTSIPTIHYPQGAMHDNPFQVHVHEDWSHEMVMDTLPGITAHSRGAVVGTYLARKGRA